MRFNSSKVSHDYQNQSIVSEWTLTTFTEFAYKTFQHRFPIVRAVLLFAHSKYKEFFFCVWEYRKDRSILKVVPVKSALKFKIDVNVPPLLSFVVSTSQNGEF